MPAVNLNLNNIFYIRANDLKLQDFFRNLSGKILKWSVSDDCLDFRK